MERSIRREGNLSGEICGGLVREFQTSSENKDLLERDCGEVIVDMRFLRRNNVIDKK
jgi:hypothetical protein